QKNVEWKSTLSPPPNKISSPLSYFHAFFSPDLIDKIAQESNRYAMRKSEKELKATPAEIRKFLTILIFSGIFKTPSFRAYWKNEARFGIIANLMTRNR